MVVPISLTNIILNLDHDIATENIRPLKENPVTMKLTFKSIFYLLLFVIVKYHDDLLIHY